jgi:hypothetical protein
VRVESWFDADEPAVGAVVEVVRAGDGTPVFKGKTDDGGNCVFPFPEFEDLRVRILAGGGHAAMLTISAARLRQPDTAAEIQRDGKSASDPGGGKVTAIDRSVRAGDILKDVLVGVGFLLALAAFVISLRNAQQIKLMNKPH